MNTKKIFMIVILVAFIVVIGIVFININKTSVQKISESQENNTANTTSVQKISESQENNTTAFYLFKIFFNDFMFYTN